MAFYLCLLQCVQSVRRTSCEALCVVLRVLLGRNGRSLHRVIHRAHALRRPKPCAALQCWGDTKGQGKCFGWFRTLLVKAVVCQPFSYPRLLGVPKIHMRRRPFRPVHFDNLTYISVTRFNPNKPSAISLPLFDNSASRAVLDSGHVRAHMDDNSSASPVDNLSIPKIPKRAKSTRVACHRCRLTRVNVSQPCKVDSSDSNSSHSVPVTDQHALAVEPKSFACEDEVTRKGLTRAQELRDKLDQANEEVETQRGDLAVAMNVIAASERFR